MGLPRIPPYYRRKGYQRFFGGLFIGFIGGWVFFMINTGTLIEEYIVQIKAQQIKITELEERVKLYQEDQVKQNEENQKKLLVEEIAVHFLNNDEDAIGRLELLNLEKAIKNDLKIVLQKDVESVSANRELIKQLLHNKDYQIDENKYKITITEMYLYTTLELYVKVTQIA